LNFVLEGEGISPLSFELARPMIGHGARVLLGRGFDALGLTCAPDDMDRMFKTYIEHYAGRIAQLTRPFPGLEGALDTLAAVADLRFALVLRESYGWSLDRIEDWITATSRTLLLGDA
jgi:phosphoglycolate phosphatase